MRLLAALALPAILLLPGCATNSRLSPVAQAAHDGDIATLKSLLDAGASINGELLLHHAAKGSTVPAVKFLLERGADPNAPDIDGDTPIFYAWGVMDENPEVIRLLLAAGADATHRNRKGQSVYQWVLKNPDTSNPLTRRYVLSAVEGKGSAKAREGEHPRTSPGNLDDAAYDRMRASAGLPPEVKEVASDIDLPKGRAPERPDDFALVVGIEDYQSVPKADYGVRDAAAVRRHLEALGVPARNVISLFGSQATGNKLKSYLEEWLPLNVKPNSTLFVYYSGHGAPDPKTGEAYLVPWDGDPTFLKSTALPLRKLYSDLSKTPAKRVIVALDACFSGAGGRSVLAQGARPLVAKVADMKAGDRITVLAAASGDEITGALPDKGHGMFTYFLLKGLIEGKRSAKALVDYLTPRVQDEARRQNRLQTPALIGADASF